MSLSTLLHVPLRGIARMRESVTAKVMVVVMAALALVIVLYSHLLLQCREQWLRDQLIHSQQSLNRAFMAALVEEADQGHEAALGRFFANLNRHSPLLAMRVLDGDSQVVFASRPEQVGRLFGSDRAAAEGDPNLRAISPLPARAQCRQCHAGAGDVMGNIVIDFPPEAVNGPLRRDRLHLVSYAAAILVMVGGIVMLLMWAVVHNPLQRLSSLVRHVQQGDLASRCVMEGRDEFHELGDGFNAMLASIDRQRGELESLHARQIAQADRLASIGKLASGLAHEIKNPLHGIASALTVVARRVEDPALGEIVGEIQDQTRRVAELLNDMLAYARPSRPAFEWCRLESIVDKAHVLLQADLRERNLQLVREYEDDLPAVQADPGKLQQVLLNLLLNAIQASDSGGAIFVSLRRVDADRVSIRIHDSGPGIDPELAPRIFEPFYTTKADGNGLGLAITRTLVEQHQGRLRLVPTHRKGACFEIELPLRLPDEPSLQPVESLPS